MAEAYIVGVDSADRRYGIRLGTENVEVIPVDDALNYALNAGRSMVVVAEGRGGVMEDVNCILRSGRIYRGTKPHAQLYMFNDAGAALEHVKNYPPDFIFTDINVQGSGAIVSEALSKTHMEAEVQITERTRWGGLWRHRN